MTTTTVKVEIQSFLEIPLAYSEAIRKWKDTQSDDEADDDIWDGKIELKQINFENNFRRKTYVCVFEITVGSYLYGK